MSENCLEKKWRLQLRLLRYARKGAPGEPFNKAEQSALLQMLKTGRAVQLNEASKHQRRVNDAGYPYIGVQALGNYQELLRTVVTGRLAGANWLTRVAALIEKPAFETKILTPARNSGRSAQPRKRSSRAKSSR